MGREVVTTSNKWIVDSREPAAVKRILKKNKIPFIEDTLPVGDFVLGEIIIERKTISDLANSFASQRIWNQLRDMLLQGGKPYLLVELRGKDWWQTQYTKYLSAVSIYCAKHDIGLLITHNRRQLANTLKSFMNGKRKSISLKKKWKGYPEHVIILAQFPNIGVTKAKELLMAFPTLRDIFEADYEKLARIIGKVTAEKFVTILDTNPIRGDKREI